MLHELNATARSRNTAAYKYERVRQHVLSLIKRHKLGPGAPLPSERELSETLGVSQGTVVRSLRELVKEGLLTRIQGKGTLVGEGRKPGTGALALVMRERGGEAIISSQVSFFQRAKGLLAATAQRGLPLNLLMVTSSMEEDKMAERIQADASLCGVLLYETWGLDRLAARLGEAGFPYAVLYGTAGSALPGVVLKEREGGRAGMEYLLGLGHQRIAVISGPESTAVYRERMAGCRDAWSTFGREAAALAIVTTAQGQEGGYRAVRELLENPAPPTAVFCLSDFKALGALEAAREAGISVPGALSILGFDGLDFSASTEPPLSTMAIDHGAVAEAALRLLLDGTPSELHALIETRLVERGTTAAPGARGPRGGYG